MSEYSRGGSELGTVKQRERERGKDIEAQTDPDLAPSLRTFQNSVVAAQLSAQTDTLCFPGAQKLCTW